MNMKINFITTDRGLLYGEFTDASGYTSTIGESSSNRESGSLIWLGLPGHAMHLTKSHAATLWPLLKGFAETGELAVSISGDDQT